MHLVNLGLLCTRVRESKWTSTNVLFSARESRECLLFIKGLIIALVKLTENSEGKFLLGSTVHTKKGRKLDLPPGLDAFWLLPHLATLQGTLTSLASLRWLLPGYLISRCDHSRKTAFPSLLFIGLCVSHLEKEIFWITYHNPTIYQAIWARRLLRTPITPAHLHQIS